MKICSWSSSIITHSIFLTLTVTVVSIIITRQFISYHLCNYFHCLYSYHSYTFCAATLPLVSTYTFPLLPAIICISPLHLMYLFLPPSPHLISSSLLAFPFLLSSFPITFFRPPDPSPPYSLPFSPPISLLFSSHSSFPISFFLILLSSPPFSLLIYDKVCGILGYARSCGFQCYEKLRCLRHRHGCASCRIG